LRLFEVTSRLIKEAPEKDQKLLALFGCVQGLNVCNAGQHHAYGTLPAVDALPQVHRMESKCGSYFLMCDYSFMEYLIGYEGNAFAFTGDARMTC